MKQVSVKTVMLLVALLAVAVVSYSTAGTSSARGAIAWLDDEPNLPPDPNQPVDPNAPAKPIPEMVLSTGSLLRLDIVPVDANEPPDPNQPVDPNVPAKPIPEMVLSTVRCSA
jgi:hypothetical protein